MFLLKNNKIVISFLYGRNDNMIILKIYSILILTMAALINLMTVLTDKNKEIKLSNFACLILVLPIIIYLIWGR